MAKLTHKNNSTVLIANLQIAQSFMSRLVGLLNRKSLRSDEALWIHQCNSIHTFFMKFTIDCVFVDKNMVIKKIFTNIKPGRMTWPVWSASSVIEMSAGLSQTLNLKEGDELNVVS